MLDPEYDFTAQYHRVRPQPAKLPSEIAVRTSASKSVSRNSRKPRRIEWTDAL